MTFDPNMTRAEAMFPYLGPLMEVPNVACHFLEIAMSHVSVAYFPQCHMSNLRNDYVPCHYICKPQCCMSLTPCHMSNIRNDHVALLILGVKGHIFTVMLLVLIGIVRVPL